MTNFALISDVHSQSDKLNQALNVCHKNNLTPLFLGDLFDSKCDNSDSFGVYELVRNAQETAGAIVLQSNHQNKLIRYLRGNNVMENFGLDKTIVDLFETKNLDQNEILTWLESFPYAIVFRDNHGKEYRASHAYFSSQIEVPEYENYHLIHDVTKKQMNQMLYGIFSGRDRIAWWENHSNNDWIRVCGHYHVVHMDSYSIVLDGCCGENEGALLLYEVNSKKLHRF